MRRAFKLVLRTLVRGGLRAAGAVEALVPRRAPERFADPGPGLTVLVPERGNAALLGECLRCAERAAASVTDPLQLLVVVNGSPREDYAALQDEHPRVEWIFEKRPLGFTGAVRRGLERARHGWVYLLNNDMFLAPDALEQVLRWRAPSVFAVASQIFFQDASRRREETGWATFRINDGLVEAYHRDPEDQVTVRGAPYAGGGASLFQRDLLGRLIAHSRAYAPFYWEDAEWGARAHGLGYDVLFCPLSKATHVHRATVSRFYPEREVDRVFRRNWLIYQMRNPLPDLRGSALVKAIARSDWRTLLELAARVPSTLAARWRALRDPFDAALLPFAAASRFLVPPEPADRRPVLLIATPYVIEPPAHGGAVRLRALIAELAREFRVVVASDEEDGYARAPAQALAPVHALHAVGGRPNLQGDRVTRIKNHSRPLLAELLRKRIAADRPALVEANFIELAGLEKQARDGVPWALHLHDVLLSEQKSSAADRFERALIGRHDAVVVCSREDAALMRHAAVRVVPNCAPARQWRPSSGRKLLFLGPFRYTQNFTGLVVFLEVAYPALLERVPGVSIDVLAGTQTAPAGFSCFQQPGVRLHGYVRDTGPFLEGCAATINPLRGIRGSSLKLIEALSAGRVCVSTIEGARGFVDAGFRSLIAVREVAQMVEPLTNLLLDEASRHDLERPDDKLLARYRWESAGADLAAFYRELARA
jgi:GT2 family glycosyltransferase